MQCSEDECDENKVLCTLCFKTEIVIERGNGKKSCLKIQAKRMKSHSNTKQFLPDSGGVTVGVFISQVHKGQGACRTS